MAGETFKLNFITNGEGEFTISEPVGFDSADFSLMQDSKRYGRDVAFSGGNKEFTFYRMNDHKFDLLMYYYETYGWESEVQLIIIKDGIDNIIGDLDFFNSSTDQLEYFKCKVIQESSQAILKRRDDVKVDLFSDKSVDDNDIDPISTEKVLIKSKPIVQNSIWETPSALDKNINVDAGQLESDTEYFIFNPAVNIIKSEIDDTLTVFDSFREVETIGTARAIRKHDFILIEAQNNLKNINIDITNLDYNISAILAYGKGYANYELELRHGSEWESAKIYKFFNGRLDDGDSYSDTKDYNYKIDSLNRGDKIWFYFFCKINAKGQLLNGASIDVDLVINSLNVDITATSTAYNTVVPSVRLYDGVSQVVESISGLETTFPFAEPNGEMYNQRLFNGNLLRNITDKPFYFSFKDIQGWLPEINGDYEIQSDNKVFFGKYEDFYKNNEVGVFDKITFEDYKKGFNKRYAINQFYYKYKKYQSQKENEVANTFDVVHGMSEWSILNKFVENKKEVSIPFVRDSFYIDEQRRKSLDLTESTSTQDDDTIFIVDCKSLDQDLTFQETDFLQHTYQNNGYLKLSNTGTFSFVLLGLAVGDTFKILGGDSNAGTYTIQEVTERYITINKGSGSDSNNGERNTQFEYVVTTTTAPFTSWSNEDFAYVNNISDEENYANLKYTIKRNIVRFYNQYLATCNLYTGSSIKNTLYKSNLDLELSYGGVETIEGNEFTPETPILSPYTHKITVVTDFNTYKALEDEIRLNRGYIRTYDANKHVIKIYPTKLTYVNNAERGELTIEGEEKYEKAIIEIVNTGLGYVTLNDEYIVQKIKYENIGEKFYIFDEVGRLLYNPVFWHKISVNGATATDKNELEAWLTLIS